MAFLSVKELFFRRECVFLQSVSTILQLIVAQLLMKLGKKVLYFFYKYKCSENFLSFHTVTIKFR